MVSNGQLVWKGLLFWMKYNVLTVRLFVSSVVSCQKGVKMHDLLSVC